MKKLNTIFILAAMAALWSSCLSQSSSRQETDAVQVEVYQPEVSAQAGISVSGILSASQSAVISTRMMAYVDQILVRPGDKVRAGQILVRLNSDDLKAKQAQASAQYREAQAATRNAERDYNRFVTLHSQQSVSDKELENMELHKVSMQSKLEMAQQALSEVEAMLAYTDIRSPFSGVVAQKLVEKGNMAHPGMPLMVVEQPGKMEVRASVPENYVSHAKVGDKVLVDVKSLGCTLSGTISELSSSASLSGGQYTMKVDVDLSDRKDILSGMFVGIRLSGQPSATIQPSGRIWISQSSLVQREQLRGVYVVSPEGRALLRWVRLGKEEADRVEVLSGLGAGEQVVLVANGKLYNGRKVSVTK